MDKRSHVPQHKRMSRGSLRLLSDNHLSSLYLWTDIQLVVHIPINNNDAMKKNVYMKSWFYVV